MEVLRKAIDQEKRTRDCSVVVDTTNGEITMYGEIVNGVIQEDGIDASFWNLQKFRNLPEEEQEQVKRLVAKELEEFTYL